MVIHAGNSKGYMMDIDNIDSYEPLDDYENGLIVKTRSASNIKNKVIEVYDGAGQGEIYDVSQFKKSQGDNKITKKIRIDPQVVYLFAKRGLSRSMIAKYYRLKESEFDKACEDYDVLDDAFNCGVSIGVYEAACHLDDQIEGGSTAATVFKLKSVGGWIEAEKRKENASDAPRVQIFLPDNNRD